MNLKEKLKAYNIVIKEVTPARIYYDIDLSSIEDNHFDTDSYSTDSKTKVVKPLVGVIEYEIEIDDTSITDEPISGGELLEFLDNIDNHIDKFLHDKYKIYQLQWMMERNLGISDLLDVVREDQDNLFEIGFDGEIFASFDEWLKNDSGYPHPFKF